MRKDADACHRSSSTAHHAKDYSRLVKEVKQAGLERVAFAVLVSK
jgi:methylmalonyl-CoA mutase cobalamin-binding subunit